MLNKLFPKSFEINVIEAQKVLREDLTYDRQAASVWTLSNGEIIEVPYRLDIRADVSDSFENMSRTQKTVLNCIFSRSHNGYVRQKHTELLLKQDICEWTLPYIIQLGSEYIENIVSIIYNNFKKTADSNMLRLFCHNNADNLNKCYERMISYWNEYYRTNYPDISEYEGYKLFHEYLYIDDIRKKS